MTKKEVQDKLAALIKAAKDNESKRQTTSFQIGSDKVEVKCIHWQAYKSGGYNYPTSGQINIYVNRSEAIAQKLGPLSSNAIFEHLAEAGIKFPDKIKGKGGTGKRGLSALERAKMNSGTKLTGSERDPQNN